MKHPKAKRTHKPTRKAAPAPTFRHAPPWPPLVFLANQADINRETQERSKRLEDVFTALASEALRMQRVRGPKGVDDRLTCWRQVRECIGFDITIQIDIKA